MTKYILYMLTVLCIYSKQRPFQALRHQSRIQVRHERVELIAEQLMHFAEFAVLRERRVIEVVGLNAQIRGDVVADHRVRPRLTIG